MSTLSVHDDWLALIEVSGPFLAVPVLKEVFPQGLEALDATKRKRLRQAYEEWRQALELEDAQFDGLHMAWIDEVLSRGLELNEDDKGDVLKRADWCATNLNASLPEHDVTLSPDLAVVDEQRANKPLLLIQTYAQDVDLDVTLKQEGWAATPAERMVQLCRSLGCRLGLVTNGERWMLVDAPVGAVTTFASWYARIWCQEPITLQAFVHLLGIRRFFVDETEQLPALFDRSLKFQDEVTDALGEQVRRAVEVLIQSLDKVDQDRNRELLRDVKETELYEAALTVMMRLVFLLSAEERGLLLLGDERYEANYAISTLRMQLRTESDEILERRWDAWSRLLAVFRAVYGGIEHENLRLPALGGSLFDPDRFSFLEGRAKGTNWRTDAAKPLPINNRTVLLLLEAIQQFQGRTLSYRALDVEQIGYVYEGLLERTVKRTDEVTLELDATKSAKTPWVKLAELGSAQWDGTAQLTALLKERTGSSVSRVRNDLAKPVNDTLADRLLTACQGDTQLRNRIKPYAHLLRTDPWGYPLVYPAGAFIVTTGSDRRETGTHYTPKSLTEAIVIETLTPITYVGPAQGTPRADWVLKSPAELLDLKICDPAMGSGAFLVQACRWLADRLGESWAQAEAQGHTVGIDGSVMAADANVEPLPRDTDARTIVARRLIAERCLYGVDLNPLAVELAKLSIWLVTLAKGRPFGFLDHNLRCGDSLLGVHRLDQLTQLSMSSTGQGQLRLFGQNIEQAVREAIELRQLLREMPIRDIRDVEAMAYLDADARRRLAVPESIADAFIGEVFASGGSGAALENALVSLTVQAGQAINGDRDVLALMRRRSVAALSTDLPADKPARRPFHWPLEFPEVFARKTQGFDAIVGNPPFLGGKRISSAFGDLCLAWIKRQLSFVGGSADLSAYFLLRCTTLVGHESTIGLVATNSISQGDTREVGLAQILGGSKFVVYRAETSIQWPGQAAVYVALVYLFQGEWQGVSRLNGKEVAAISSFLDDQNSESVNRLVANADLSHMGTNVYGTGFRVPVKQALTLISKDRTYAEVLRPFLNGIDINKSPKHACVSWVIDFGSMPLEKARSYGECFAIVEEHVLPVRQKSKRKPYREKWWLFAERQANLYAAIAEKERCLAIALTSNTLAFAFVPTNQIFSNATIVIAWDDYAHFAMLQSDVHTLWARKYGSSMKGDARYTPTDCFQTFPFPNATDQLLEIGADYELFRSKILTKRDIGLTKLYVAMNDPTVLDPQMDDFRELHRQLSLETLDAYGWSDLNLEHGFHEVSYLPENDRVRFTISETARVEVLRRLSELNRQRYEEEIAQGLHGNTTSRTLTPKRRRTSADAPQPSLDFDTLLANEGQYLKVAEPRPDYRAGPAHAIVEYLKTHPGWHAKSDILAATRITDGQWNTAINELIASSKVERQGELRGARYRIKP